MEVAKTRVHLDRRIVYQDIIDRLRDVPNPTKDDVNKIKIDVCRRYHTTIPKNSEVLNFLKIEERPTYLNILRSKPVRTISGINVVAVMTVPSNCPHGKCAYCPGGPKYNVPSSYTGREPATMRAIQNKYDPFFQVKNRIDQLRAIGHPVSKVELIVMGGTFPATVLSYQDSFIKGCLDAITEIYSHSREEAQLNAEKSEVRIVGLTFETRPDYCKQSHVDRMLELGATRIELGVQSIYNDIYRFVNRGHTIQDVVEATKILKNSGLKVCYHMMLGLPGSNVRRDIDAFKTIFVDQKFRPDMLKIYPCLVLKSAKIYNSWKEGNYKPYTTKEAVEILVKVKRLLPPWVRVMRVQRDIPAQLIIAGVNKGNLRQIVQEEMRKRNLHCRCIRCREVGHRMLSEGITQNPENIKIITQQYNSSDGLEFFISAEDKEDDVLIGFIRLRIPSLEAHRPEIKKGETAIVRELHIYGPIAPLGVHRSNTWQHRGFGRALLKEAERTSFETGCTRILVTSALGVREYFKRLGYKRMGFYMGKRL